MTPRELLHSFSVQLIREYGPRPLKLPAGLRLEMHPTVRLWFLLDEELWRYTSMPPDGGDPFAAIFEVPVKVTEDLPKDQWRFVIATERVIGHGEIP